MSKSTLLAFALTALTASVASANETVKDAAKDVKVGVKKALRAAKDEACPLVDGKVVCAGKKVKHKAENAADEATK